MRRAKWPIGLTTDDGPLRSLKDKIMKARLMTVLACALLAASGCVMEPYGSGYYGGQGQHGQQGYGGGGHWNNEGGHGQPGYGGGSGYNQGGHGQQDYGHRVWQQ